MKTTTKTEKVLIPIRNEILSRFPQADKTSAELLALVAAQTAIELGPIGNHEPTVDRDELLEVLDRITSRRS